MKEQIQVTYDPETNTFREMNPKDKEPAIGEVKDVFLSYGKIKEHEYWQDAESKLRSFKLPDEAEELLQIASDLKFLAANCLNTDLTRLCNEARLVVDKAIIATKEKRLFTEDNMRKCWIDAIDKKEIFFDDYINSLHPTYQPDKIYTVEVEGDKILRIVE